MAALSMSRDEREAFLADVHVGLIAIERPGQAPLATPIWYDYTPERGIWVLTGRDSLKGKALRAAERFTLVAQTETAPYRYVSVEGPVSEMRPADLERDRRPMAHRYLGREFGDRYVAGTESEESWLFVMQPERWRTVDYAKLALTE